MPVTVKLILVRHGHVEGIDPPRFRGRWDLELSPRGECEARATAARIAGRWQPTHLYTSPLRRARQTAQAIAQATDLTSVVLDELSDLDYGAWQGLTYDETRAKWPVEMDCWLHAPHLALIPNGETLQDVAARATRTFANLARRHPDETIVVVAHETVNRVLLLHVLELSLARFWGIPQATGAINVISADHTSAEVQTMNDVHHLERIDVGGHGTRHFLSRRASRSRSLARPSDTDRSS